MIKFLHKVSIVFVLTCIWIILNDKLSVQNILTGILASCLSLYATYRLVGFEYVKIFYIPIRKVLKYAFFMLKEIYIAGIYATYYILTGKTHAKFIHCKIDSKIKNQFLKQLVGNSITMTPGTITVVNDDGKLIVLCLHNDEPEHMLCRPFEEKLLDIQLYFDKQAEKEEGNT